MNFEEALELYNKSENKESIVLELYQVINNLVENRIRSLVSSPNKTIIDDVKPLAFIKVLKEAETITFNRLSNYLVYMYKKKLRSFEIICSGTSNERFIDKTYQNELLEFKMLNQINSLNDEDKLNLLLICNFYDKPKCRDYIRVRDAMNIAKLLDMQSDDTHIVNDISFSKYITFLSILNQFNKQSKILFLFLGLNNFTLLCSLNEILRLNLKVPDLTKLEEMLISLDTGKVTLEGSIEIDTFNGSVEEFLLSEFSENLILKLDKFLNSIDVNNLDSSYLKVIDSMIKEFNTLMSKSVGRIFGR